MTNKKPVPLEKSVVNRILKWLNNEPNSAGKKTYGNGHSAGWPDVVGCYHGRMLALEVKRPGNTKVTELQKATLAIWQEAGAIAGVVHSLEEVQELIKEG